jgi:lipoyl-dependent peroxiredoxin
MAKPVYTAQARVTGGRENGRGWTSDGLVDLGLRMPTELGGEGGGANPEQLFAIGYAACFETVLRLLGQKRKIDVGEPAIDAKVMLIPIGNGAFRLGVELDVSLPAIRNREGAADLVRAAHQVCPYSNATRGNVDVALTVNGSRV